MGCWAAGFESCPFADHSTINCERDGCRLAERRSGGRGSKEIFLCGGVEAGYTFTEHFNSEGKSEYGFIVTCDRCGRWRGVFNGIRPGELSAGLHEGIYEEEAGETREEGEECMNMEEEQRWTERARSVLGMARKYIITHGLVDGHREAVKKSLLEKIDSLLERRIDERDSQK